MVLCHLYEFACPSYRFPDPPQRVIFFFFLRPCTRQLGLDRKQLIIWSNIFISLEHNIAAGENADSTALHEWLSTGGRNPIIVLTSCN